MFSATVSFRKTDGSCGRYVMPSRARRYIGSCGDLGLPKNTCPRVGPHAAHDHVERRGLAGAVRTEQPDDLAGVHLDVDAADDVLSP